MGKNIDLNSLKRGVFSKFVKKNGIFFGQADRKD